MKQEIRVSCKGAGTLPLSEIHPFQGELKSLSKENFAKLRGLILAHGITSPIHVWKNGGKHWAVDGHQRQRVLSELAKEGYRVPEIPVVFIDAKDEKTAKRILLSHVAQFGKVEDQGLYEFMSGAEMNFEELAGAFDIPGMDLDHFGAEYFKDEVRFNAKTGVDEDEVPEVTEKPKAKLGDLIVLGNHRLMCGDATDPRSWDSVCGGSAPMVFTSPPYGVGGCAKLREKYVRGAKTMKSLYRSHGDDPDHWPALMRGWTDQAIARAALVICNVQMLANNKAHLIAWQSAYAEWLSDVAIWDKGCGPPQMQRNVLTNVFEYLFILSSQKGATRSIPLSDFHGDQGNVVRIGRNSGNEFAGEHKATMPVALAEWAIGLGLKSDWVIDPFGGTGTTMIAAEKCGRAAGLIELDPHYCDVIVARWEKYTGQKAVRPGAKNPKARRRSARAPGKRAGTTPRPPEARR